MANLFYIEQINQKQSPKTEQQLKELAKWGHISADTLIETDTGETITAGQIPGLEFNTSAPPSLDSIEKWMIGVIVAVVGLVMMLYGNSLNNSVEAQLSSLFSNGQTNPGTLWMIIGGVALGIGAILAIADLTSNKK